MRREGRADKPGPLGSLYSVVEALHKHGLIEAKETLREGRRPERTIYAITNEGTAEFEDWLAELLSTPVREFTSLEAGLFLMPGLPPKDVAQLLDGRAERLRIALRALEATRAVAAEGGLPELFLVEDFYRHAMTTAELEFVTKLAADVRSGALGGSRVWQQMYDLMAAGTSFEEISADPVRYLGEEDRLIQQPQGD